MAPDDHSGGAKPPAAPVVLRIKLRYDDVETMVQRFAPNVGKSGLFLPTKSIQPVGTEVKFELRLANDAPVLVGLGRVKHVKAPDPAAPKAAFGMAIELMRVSREGRELIIKMIERRRAMGMADVAIPVPEDVDTARRADLESQPRADTSGIVRDAMKDFASAPVAEQVLSAPRPSELAAVPKPIEHQPSLAVVAPIEPPARPSEPPARPSEPAVPKAIEGTPSKPVPSLSPERERAKRPRPADMIAKATELSGPLAAIQVPGLDEHVDVERALARARALAAGVDLDGELSALREQAAAPLGEISIEAASAELARQLGGKPIAKRERSGKWVPPPAVAPPATGTRNNFGAKTRAETEASPSAIIASVTSAAAAPEPHVEPPVEPIIQLAVESAAPPPPPEPELAATSIGEALADAVDAAAREQEIDTASPSPIEPEHSDPARDYAADEKTRIPVGDEYENAFLPSASTTTSVDPEDALEVPVEDARRSFSSIDEEQLRTQPGEHLRDEVMIDDNVDVRAVQARLESSPALPLDDSDIEPVDDDDGDGSTHIGAFPMDPHAFGQHGYPTTPDASDQLADQLDRQLAEAEAEADDDFRALTPDVSQSSYPPPSGIYEIGQPAEQYAEQYNEQFSEQYNEQYNEQYAEQEGSEEVSDFDVVGEAAAHDVQPEPEPALEPEPEPDPDFASRLDLDDDAPDPREFDEIAVHPRPSLRAQSDFPDPASNSYTFAEPFPQSGVQFAPHDSGEDFDEPHAFQTNTPVPPTPSRAPREQYAPSYSQPPSEDLEDALAALDVDLDDIALEKKRARRASGGHRPLPGLPLQRDPGTVTPAPAPPPSRPARAPTTPPPIPMAARRQGATTPPPIPVRPPPKRATTDDGVLIDFDDDE